MSRFISLHESEAPGSDLAEKYGVPTYEQYKAWCRTTPIPDRRENPLHGELSPLQRMAFSLVVMTGTIGAKPEYIVLGRSVLEQFVREETQVPETFEGLGVTYNLNQPFGITYIL